jgi:pimeloyl-ACP methyl ester carboxylesterase
MMIWGEEDSLPGTDPGAMDRLVDHDNTPRFETIPGAGHLPQLEKPAEVVERILEFAAPTPARP